MDRVPDIAVSVPLHTELEGTSEERFRKVHEYICSLIAMLGGFLPLKQGARNESLFDTDYPAMVSLIVALIAYGGLLIASRMLYVQAHPNSNLAKSMINKISLLFGTLALILEVVILVPGLGKVAGFFWVGWFVKVVAEYTNEYLKMLYESAVASVVYTFGKLEDYLNMIIRRFATEPEEQTDELPQVTFTTV
ncbi:hypothetical protein D8674_018395 [Pyrus ussuriensis x Pyrus communis]|uniref:Uncharacterized protein n=1 Tax=Pyrus ussuriensis x Pyrus communis TaxID=2448454 RepID=A0A5N5G4V1_9ROSA|nr:hypothetical protein D8674_018395 [Pyrus ussuriensis x Pyrus communis]